MAVWTGTEAILWGGEENVSVGLAYDPVTDRWRTLPPAPLEHRGSNTLVWTGDEAIVWGGFSLDHTTALADGAAYNPTTDTWRTLRASPLQPRMAHTAVWTGHEMLVWGGVGAGEGATGAAPQGAAYDPTKDTWRVLRDAPLATRGWHSAVWTGREMLVYGGTPRGSGAGWLTDGAAYDPASDIWELLPPSAGSYLQDTGETVWTGRQMIIWGGSIGAAYDPATRLWTSVVGAPFLARSGHRMVWTGDQIFIWGGFLGATTYYNDGATYRPAP
jgi:N-acetylneuraminic acid mutarotase